MSSNKDTYSGPIPIPTKVQSVKEFEEEELSKEQYTEFKTVAELLSDPEKYAEIVNNENFKSMIEREKEGKKEDKPDESKAPADKPPPATDVTGAPSADLDVRADIDTSEKLMEEPVESEPSTKSTSSTPSVGLQSRDLDMIGKVSITEKAGLLFIDKDGFHDLADGRASSEFDPSSKRRYAKYYQICQTFVQAGRVNNGYMINDEGFLSANLNFDMSELELSAASEIKRDLSSRESVAIRFLRRQQAMGIGLLNCSTPGGAQTLSNRHVTDDPAQSVIDLSMIKRRDGFDRAAVCMINPARIPYLLEALRAHEYLFIRYDDLIADPDHLRLMNANLLGLVRRPEVSETERFTSTTSEVYRYPRLTIPGMIPFFYGAALNEPYFISRSLFSRSLSMAKESVMHFAAGMRGVQTTMQDRQVSAKMDQLRQIQPGKGVEFMSSTCAGLLGGHNHNFTVDIEEGNALTKEMLSLCSYATLVLMDWNWLEPESVKQLVYNTLIPFFGEDDEMRVDARNLPIQLRGVQSVGDNYVNGVGRIPAPTRFMSARGRAEARANLAAVAGNLQRLLDSARRRVFAMVPRRANLMNTPVQDPSFMFAARADIFNMVLYGNRTAFNESPRYDVNYHRQDAQVIREMIFGWCSTLSSIRAYEGMNRAFEELVPLPKSLAKSMAIATSGFIQGAQNTDLLPMTGLNGNPCDKIMLPLTGAMSFILHGITSSEIETDSDYVVFKDKLTPKFGSQYPLQYTMERAILHELMETFRRAPEDYTITRIDEVVKLHKHIMSLYFTTVDSSSEDRIRMLIDRGSAFPMGGIVRIPAELRSTLYSNAPTVDPVDIGAGIDMFRGHCTLDVDDEGVEIPDRAVYPPNVGPVYPKMFKATENILDRVYVMFDPQGALRYVTYDGRKTMVFNPEINEADLIDIEDILFDQPYAKPGALDYAKLTNMAKLYMRKNRRMDAKGVLIKDIYAKFTVHEVDVPEDHVHNEMSFSVEINPQYKDYSKYTINNISIPVHKIKDTHDSIGGQFELTRLQNIMSYICIPVSTFEQGLVHVANAETMSPGLYKRENNAEIESYSLTNQRLVGWNGVTYSSRMTLCKRDKEEVKLNTELIRREVLI